MRLKRAFVFVHKWLALIVGIQIAIWLLSGLVMAVLPIETVRSEHNIAAHAPPALETLLPVSVTPGQAITLAGGNARSVTLTTLLGQPVYEVKRDGGPGAIVDARSGAVITPITREIARQLAIEDFGGSGSPVSVEPVAEEGGDYRGALPAWRVTFNDTDATRIYVDAGTGRVSARRSDTWRLYDFFWMLHIMDYGARENFNTPWLIVLAAAGLFVALSGLPLLWYSVLKPLFMRRRAAQGLV